MIPSYQPIKMGRLQNGNMIVEFQPVQLEQVDFVKEFYGRKLDSEHFRLAELVALPKERMKFGSRYKGVDDEDEEEGE